MKVSIRMTNDYKNVTFSLSSEINKGILVVTPDVDVPIEDLGTIFPEIYDNHITALTDAFESRIPDITP